ncbi:MAG: hypothetical protein C0624_06575 [Desulfuromonas sp.]|nr:MAG: hypothetical protein C0624_06575 [Desulfuromonas sp.]
MELPELVRKNAEKHLDDLCLRLNNDPGEESLFGYKVEGEALTLYSRQVQCQQMVTHPVARFRFSGELGQWALQSFDEQQRWRPYLNAGPSLNLAQLIVHVEQDPFGFFRVESPPPRLA